MTRTLRAGALSLLAVFAAAAAALVALGPAPPTGAQTIAGEPAQASPGAARFRIVDGDTLQDRETAMVYRLVNVDTPETGGRARCDAERDLGARATAMTRALVGGARSLGLHPTGRIDRYGRAIAYVSIDGRALGETLIAAGLARPWRGRREPWCGDAGALLP